ncbi:MAG: permease-like cell division protein FtsX [Clostridiales bacterium]|nr:permease-like cell division protein FtsX [Clostridiales bacterium]
MNSIRYNLKQAFLQVVRNRAMSLASVFSIMAMLLILGVSFVTVVNIGVAMEKAKEGYDTVLIHLEDDTAEWQVENIIDTLRSMQEVQEATFLPKDDALEQWKTEWGNYGYLLDSLPKNPLPDGVVVKLSDLVGADKVVRRATNFNGVLEVKYYRDTVEKLMKVTNFIQMAALVIMGFLIIISVVVVSNTIKLTVFARAEEINIMKYIGATNWFIRGPFLVEGVIIGLISASLSVGVISLVYYKVIELVQSDITNMFKFRLVPMEFMSYNLIWIFIALGVSIGACGSIISMRRFLDT